MSSSGQRKLTHLITLEQLPGIHQQGGTTLHANMRLHVRPSIGSHSIIPSKCLEVPMRRFWNIWSSLLLMEHLPPRKFTYTCIDHPSWHQSTLPKSTRFSHDLSELHQPMGSYISAIIGSRQPTMQLLCCEKSQQIPCDLDCTAKTGNGLANGLHECMSFS